MLPEEYCITSFKMTFSLQNHHKGFNEKFFSWSLFWKKMRTVFEGLNTPQQSKESPTFEVSCHIYIVKPLAIRSL